MYLVSWLLAFQLYFQFLSLLTESLPNIKSEIRLGFYVFYVFIVLLPLLGDIFIITLIVLS